MPENDKPIGELKPIQNNNSNASYKPVGKLKPVGYVPIAPINDFKSADEKAVEDDIKIESTLNFIQENSRRTLRDDEKDILKSMIKNPNTRQDELSDAIVTLQGKKAKQIDNSLTTPDYYMKMNEQTGNYVPVALEQGEKIPLEYKAASIWGTQKSAEDDNAWQDLGKSLVNGLAGAVGGVVDVAQLGVVGLTGEESETLRAAKNSTEALKFNKDSELDTPIFNTEGINQWSDLLDKDRFDFSAKSLWGTFNMAAESLVEFGLGAKGAAGLIKGGKALSAGLNGVDDVIELGKLGRKAAIFAGSFASQVGEVYDNAERAGLEGRDKAAYATLVGSAVAAIDAAYGIEGKIMSNFFRKSKSEFG